MLFFVVLLAAVASGYGDDVQCGGRDTKISSKEERLQESLLCGYASDMRPVKDHRTAVVVTVQMNLRYMSFSSLEDTLSVHAWISLQWVDEYLSWNPDDNDGLKELQISSTKIWRPMLALYNADVNVYQSSFSTPCVVNNTGHVMCVPHVVRSAICTTKLRNWPYDTQNCTMRFGSWSHKGEQVNFVTTEKRDICAATSERCPATPVGFPTFTGAAKIMPAGQAVNLGDFESGAGWALIDVAHERLSTVYVSSPKDSYPELRYYIALKRHAAGPAAIVVVPSVVIILLTLSSLLMDVKDNTRLCLASFCMFGHFLFLTQIGEDLPKHSSDTPIILTFLRDSMVLNLVGILVTLLLGSLRVRTDAPYTWVNWVNGLFTGAAKFAVFTEFEPGLLHERKETQAESSAPETRVAANLAWVSFCNVLNSFSFSIIVFVYLILFFNYLPKQ